MRTLGAAVARWLAATALLLYLVAGAVALTLDARNARRDLEILLYAEAEALASYYASTQRLDFPELQALGEHGTTRVWVRLVRGRVVMAATPGLSRMPLLDEREIRLEKLAFVADADDTSNGAMAVVRHAVWNVPGVVAEAFARDDVGARQWALLRVLAVTGVAVVPLAAAAGWLLARRTTRPVLGLLTALDKIGHSDLTRRIEVPGNWLELSRLAGAINGLLARLEESVERMRRFTSDASHELRTPLTIMRTGIEVALRRPRVAEDYLAVIQGNLLEIARVQRIVEGLLVLARDLSKGDRAAVDDVDLSMVVDGAVRTMGPHAVEKRVELRTEVEPEVRVLGNPDYLHLMVVNLLDNAVRHTPIGSCVTVHLAAAEGVARLRVTDEGPGVPTQERGRIFDRYYRVPDQDTRRVGTGGLGLSVVHWVVRHLDGDVHIIDAPGSGACFEVLIPLVVVVASAQAVHRSFMDSP